MVVICKFCVDPTYCRSVIGCCEIHQEDDIQRLEDLRQSEAFYEQLKDKEDESR